MWQIFPREQVAGALSKAYPCADSPKVLALVTSLLRKQSYC